MLREVYNNDYVVDEMTKNLWPPRWQPCPSDPDALERHNQSRAWRQKETTPGAWSTKDGFRSFACDGAGDTEAWIRYQHYIPELGGSEYSLNPNWKEIEKGPIDGVPRRRRIRNFLAYNAGLPQYFTADDGFNRHDVDDLAVECELTTNSPAGVVTLELVKSGYRFQCQLDLKAKSASLRILDTQGNPKMFDQQGDGAPKATGVLANQTSEVRFSNVDHELRLWIDGEVVKFDAPTTYDLPMSQETRWELAPVGIASRGANVSVNHLRLLRDIYYTPTRPVHRNFKLESDQFFVLGDNSSRSKDGRLWGQQYYVNRRLLIGKALMIYWPHSWDSPVPLWPNWKRMGFVH